MTRNEQNSINFVFNLRIQYIKLLADVNKVAEIIKSKFYSLLRMNINGKYITIIAIIVLFTTALHAQSEVRSRKINTVVIDPGHGGRDPGALGKVSKEKEIALAISQKLGKLINQRFPEVKVIYTRSDDRFIELYQRAEIANKAKADLFISIHANSSVKQSPSGVEFWVLGLHKADENLEVVKKENAALQFEQDVRKNYGFDPNSPEGAIIMTMQQNLYLDQSIQLAKLMEGRFVKEDNQLNRGSKQAGFIVLYKTSMPSVLVEVGFISNPDEEQYIANETGQNKIAANLSVAFADYKTKYESGAIKPVEEQKKVKPAELVAPIESNKNSGFSSTIGGKFSLEAENEKPTTDNIPKEKSIYSVDSKPVSNVLDQTDGKKKIIIDDDIEKYNETKNNSLEVNNPQTNVVPNATSPVGKVATSAQSKVSNPNASVLEAKSNAKKIITDAETEVPNGKKTYSLNSTPLAEKFEKKAVKSDNSKSAESSLTKDVTKKEIINASLKKMDEPPKTASPKVNTTTPGKIKLEDASTKVPSYLVDSEIKKEIVDNTKKIDKKQNILEENVAPEKVETKQKSTSIESKTNNAPKPIAAVSGLVYRVQIKASSTKIKPDDPVNGFDGGVDESFENGLYKYLVGSFSDEKSAHTQLEKIRNQGIKDAFIVKYKDGVRIK
jgi:N-acetylmuramoyl-L-alanine amidase